MTAKVAFAVPCLLLLKALWLAEGTSYTWGYVNKYASPIYAEHIQLTGAQRDFNVIFPEQGGSNDYTIVAMHAEDLKSEVMATGGNTDALVPPAIVLSGGIGFNYTKLRFVRHAEMDENFSLVIYGVDL